MRRRFPAFLLIAIGLTSLVVALLLEFTVQEADAQCGASTSSCKNCHEVNAQHPVNNSGDWHLKHSFGDFCSYCHGGDVQATDKTIAHKAMYYPLADIKTSCQTCHPSDTQDRAKIYAAILKVDLNTNASGTGSTGNGNTGGPNQTDPSKAEAKPIDPPGETHASGAIIDYNRQYEIDVLGATDGSKTGNIILVISAIGLFGLGFVLVWRFERFGDVWRKARAVPEWRRIGEAAPFSINKIDHPVAAIEPTSTPTTSVPVSWFERLDPQTRAKLDRILSDPLHGPEILHALSQLDPALIIQLHSISKQDRALLLAIVEKLGDTAS